MKCECPYTLKVPLGNAFQVLFPVKTAEWKDGERTVEVADVRALTDAKVFVDGEEWEQGWEMDDKGPLVNFPKDSLAKGPHNVEITADYFGVAIRAAYFECITMVQWSYESNIGNYIIGSPLVAEAAYIYVGITDDAELEALKQQYRDATAACETARLAYEAAKEELEEKAEQLNDVAQETTSQSILTELTELDPYVQEILMSVLCPNLVFVDIPDLQVSHVGLIYRTNHGIFNSCLYTSNDYQYSADISGYPAKGRIIQVRRQGDTTKYNATIVDAFSNYLTHLIGTADDTASARTIFGKLAAVLAAVGNIDFSTLAKQGDNPAATNSAILEAMSHICPEDPYSQALAAFFNITPPVPNAVPMTQQEVEDDLDELWNLIITQ